MTASAIRILELLHQNHEALSTKIASVLTLNYLKSEAALAKRGDFEVFLDAVPNVVVETNTDKVE